MDDPRLFILDDYVAEVSYIFLENVVNNAVDSKQFLVHKCSSKVLGQILLHHSGFLVHRGPEYAIIAIPQTALMKFIQNSPSMLRSSHQSNLTKDNIKILQQEHPAIEFVQYKEYDIVTTHILI